MLKPKLWTIAKTITKEQLLNDISAGIIVGVIALPLAIAFGIASGVSPEKGIITAIIGGFFVSLLGGSRVQIGGPTGAFIVVVFGVVQQYGIDGLMVATMLAGFILIIMGIAKFGSIIKFIPHPVTVGFTSGIAVIIFSSQVKDFFGLNMQKVPSEFIEKCYAFATNFSVNYYALGIGALALCIMIFWNKITHKIPGSLAAIVITTVVVTYFKLPVATIGSVYGNIPSTFPAPSIPHVDLATLRNLIQPATTIALLAAIEGLLSAVVADGMIGKTHRSNMELVAQGVANVISPLFGGIPVTGAIARTAANIKNGGRTPIAGIVHAITLLLIMLFLGRFAKLIPMTTLAAVLIIVAYNMSEWRTFISLLKSPKSDVIVLLTTFFLTVIIDLTVAIEVGVVLAVFLFMRRMAMVTNVEVITREMKDADETADPNGIDRRNVPPGVEVYEINGPFFFGAAFKFKDAMMEVENPPKIRIIRMRSVPAMDATGTHVIKEFFNESTRKGTKVLFSDVHTQPLIVFEQAGLIKLIGEENIFGNIDDSLDRAREMLGLPKVGRLQGSIPVVKREMEQP
jgi:SulP family sulfate permease